MAILVQQSFYQNDIHSPPGNTSILWRMYLKWVLRDINKYLLKSYLQFLKDNYFEKVKQNCLPATMYYLYLWCKTSEILGELSLEDMASLQV